MRGLPPPDDAVWRRRSDWFWQAHDINAGPHPLDLDTRSAALLAELELLFSAGAWAATVILGWTLVEGVARQRPDDAPSSDLDWLREQRNALAHRSAVQTDMPDDAALEKMAQGAVRTVFKTLFAAAWTAR